MTTLNGYELLQEIGSGAYGRVFLARRGGEFVALKRMERPADGDASLYERELRGVRTLMRVPPIEGVVRILDCEAAEDGRSFFYTMELADDEVGGQPDSGHYRPKSLASVADAEVALPLGECLDIAIRLATALEGLQRLHIVHRDIKPGNVLYIRGKIALADPGLLADARDAASIVGTPGYAPPERQGSPAGDVFGLGRTLYRISTGRAPEEQGLPPCAEADTGNPGFWRWMMIVAKATDQLPSRRYGSAKGMLRDLRELRRLSRAKRKGPLFWTAIALVGILAVWALVTAPEFRAWMTNDASFRYHTKPPFPYSLVKPLFVPKEDPCEPGSFFHFSEELKASKEKARNDAETAIKATESALKSILDDVQAIQK